MIESGIPNILNEIVNKKLERLEFHKDSVSMNMWKERLKRPGLHAVRNFQEALSGRKISIIGEIKKASPSKGVLREDFDPVEIARQYQSGGADAISVLTEEDFFMGSTRNLMLVRQNAAVPVLRKDFIIDPWQIYESRFIGADAILLIVSLLKYNELVKYLAIASVLGLHCLVEAHNEDEADIAVKAGAKIVGINNRDLKSFRVDLGTTERLIAKIPQDRVVVSESGVHTPEDIKYLDNLGVNAVLIGEAFMKSNNIEEQIGNIKGCAKIG